MSQDTAYIRTKHPLPWLTLFLILSCAIVCAWQMGFVDLPTELENVLVPTSRAALEAKAYKTALSYAWLHAGPMHLLANMSLLWSVGQALEASRMRTIYLVSYLAAIVAGAFAFAAMRPQSDPTQLVGASAGVFGAVGAWAATLGAARMNSTDRIQKSAIASAQRSVIQLVIINLVYGTFMARNVSNIAHIAGFVTGLVLSAILIGAKSLVRRAVFLTRRHRTSRQRRARVH